MVTTSSPYGLNPRHFSNRINNKRLPKKIIRYLLRGVNLVPMPYGFHFSLAGNSESIQILLKFSVISITSYRQYLRQIKS